MEAEYELVRTQIDRICLPAGVSSVVIPYDVYEERKESLGLKGCAYKYAPALAWLYEPDLSSDRFFALAGGSGWGAQYKFVVVLGGSDIEQLSLLATRILGEVPVVGLVYVKPSRDANPTSGDR
jgi:hypothetical protein